MKIGILIPTRGDRTEFLKFALEQMDRQTLKPDVIELVNDTPLSNDKDITWRYRIGCERLLSKDVDVVFLIEDDDYYADDYIECMVNAWDAAERPQIFGIGETTYYHLELSSYNHHMHHERASAFSTMLTAEGIRNMKWPADNYVFTDIELWKVLKGKTFIPHKCLALGIKGHKSGALFGGMGHIANRILYKNRDLELNWLKSNINDTAFNFYKTYLNK